MKKTLLFLSLFSTLFSFSQTYTIPGATEQPAWVFPLWIEDGAGNKDTLYFGYDPDAQDFGWPQSDSIFGEEFISIDTSKFNVFWQSLDYDSLTGRKVTIRFEYFPVSISFYKTYYPPLILRWDMNLFYSDALPFPDQTPAPRAWGEIITEGDMTPAGCSFQYPFIMTDTTDESGLACYNSDSMVFINGELSGLQFSIAPWRLHWLNLQDNNSNKQEFILLRNPIADNTIIIESNSNEDFLVKLFNLSNQIIEVKSFTGAGLHYFNVLENMNGLYILQISKTHFSQTLKIIIL